MNDITESGLAIRIHHTMLPVADIDRSITFYTTLLGMTLRFRRKSEARMTEQAHVGYGDGAVRSSIELTQDIGERAPEQVTPTSGHIGIDVTDIRRLCSILEQAGVTFRRPLTPNSRPGARNLTAHILDPDGHDVELIERHDD
jgi:lactoylglutathione lyase